MSALQSPGEKDDLKKGFAAEKFFFLIYSRLNANT